MKAIRKMIALTLCLCILLNLSASSVMAKDSMTDIRIGLVKLYEKKAKITIKTTNIGLGYSINNSYHCEQSFSSTSGFTFEPMLGSFYILSGVYKSYTLAQEIVKQINTFGVKAYPVSVGRNSWKVYIGDGAVDTDMEKVKKSLPDTIYKLCKGPYADNGHRVKMTGNQVSILFDGGVSNAYPQLKPMVQNSQKIAVMNLGARQYRGRLEIGRYGQMSVSAVNIVSMESYLYGVVPAEMTSAWPLEALKAQAVCSRSYALSKTGYGTDSNIKTGYRLSDTTSSQVYLGYDVETARTNQAVNSTKGYVITYQGKVITAYFFSTSGGRTEDVKDVWGVSSPYLKSVTDEYETEPEKAPWLITITASELLDKLKAYGYSTGTIQNVTIQETTASGRVRTLKIDGSIKDVAISTEKIRSILGLPSTKFVVVNHQSNPDLVYVRTAQQYEKTELSQSYVINGTGKVTALSDNPNPIYVVKSADNLTPFANKSPQQKDTYSFAGLGYGHGVGMSQSGAKGLAKEGYTYQKIIQYYYQGCLVSYQK